MFNTSKPVRLSVTYYDGETETFELPNGMQVNNMVTNVLQGEIISYSVKFIEV